MGKIHQALEKSSIPGHQVVNHNVKSDKNRVYKLGNNIILKESHPSLRDEHIDKFQGVKVRLATRNPADAIKTILITATSSGVGSTTTAVNYAVTLAQDANEKVLLIDANLRYPRLHEIFAMDHDQLLSFMLKQHESSNSIFKQIRKNLYVLAGDQHQSGPLTVFESKPFDNFLKAARDVFSFVILDGPPVNHFSDPLTIGSKVDGVLLVVDSGKTRKHAALNAKQELEDSGANILGVILNKRKYYIPDWLYNKL